MMVVREYLNKQPKSLLVALGYVLLLAVGIIDYLVPLEISVLFLLPVSLVAWFTDRWNGIVISICSAITSLIVDLLAPHAHLHFGSPYWNATTRLAFFLIIATILVDLKSATAKEKELARIDFLTGVTNGRAFWEMASGEIHRARRYEHPFTVAYVDIDNFKTVNDRFGHSAGDTLLRVVANALKSNSRAVDVIARLGGDEFAVLLAETGPEQARVVSRKLHERLLDAVRQNGWRVTFSIGVITFISPPSTVDEVIKLADGVMYSAKNSGRNRIMYEIHKVQDEPVPVA